MNPLGCSRVLKNFSQGCRIDKFLVLLSSEMEVAECILYVSNSWLERLRAIVFTIG